MARTVAACIFPAVAIAGAWLSLEEPRLVGESAMILALAILPALVRGRGGRIAAVVGSALTAAWLVFGAQPWELLPFRDEPVVSPLLEEAAQGFVDFYAVFLPFEPTRNAEMHALVLCAIFGFTLATALLVASRHAITAAAVTVAGIGWPATLQGGAAVAFGALALGAALSIPLLLRVSSARTLVAGGAMGALVVMGAAWTSSATTLARDAMLDWESWDIRGETAASSIRFAWDSNYEGVRFPKRKTVVFRVTGPAQPTYWRASTLDLFSDDHWFENLLWLGRVEGASTRLSTDRMLPVRISKRQNWTELAPRAASRQSDWLEQEVEIEAFVDDHLVAAGTPVAIDARRLGTVFQLSGSVLRVRDPVRDGLRYRVWSYVPNPSPAQLAASRPLYPVAASRFLGVDGREFPRFDAEGRDLQVQELFADPSYRTFRRYRPLYETAYRVTRGARTPYAAVLALESWLRQRGGFRYDESPPRVSGSPLVGFVTRTRAGYCQHFAGAMAVMLRMLGVPARVAVGFTSGTSDAGAWVVTDHEAHAWVEVWFRGHGWIPFDPTPGRGTFGGSYSFASDSDDAVARLRRGELSRSTSADSLRTPDVGDLLPAASPPGRPPSLVAVGLLLAAAWIVLLGVGKAVVRRARYLSRDPRGVATASRRELEGFLRDQGIRLGPHATLVTLQQAVHDEFGVDARPFAIAAARARFGHPATIAQGATTARRELRRLLRAARAELSLWARFRGLVSLRSVRSSGAL